MGGEFVTCDKYLEWRLTKATELEFKELMAEFDFLEEFSDDYYALVEKIKCLPNYPQLTTGTNYIHRVITDVWN